MTTDYQGPAKDRKPKSDPVENKIIEKVVVTEVITKKKSVGRKFKDVFFGGDFSTAGQYAVAEIILPALRNAVSATVSGFVDRALWGDSASRRRPTEYRPNIQYGSFFQRDPREMSRPPSMGARQSYRPDPRTRRDNMQFIVSTRAEAEMVVERMIDILEKYDAVSMADLNTMLGLPTTHIDNKWGWVYLNNLEIRQVREGYLLDLPPAEAL